MTANFLIIKKLNCHLSLVTSYMYLCSADRRRFLVKSCVLVNGQVLKNETKLV